ncbi:MAG TPA: UbiA family prenyltransferase [Pseudonocardiaceae bacterium]|jgi:4-hydroxybenzoate polyprenyltransferase/geranylgeranylglycerol-phosphate geranylgeranyltransferase|nr:UbiA family prenyltransferase [Pseudonocardiaceae bacterium]
MKASGEATPVVDGEHRTIAGRFTAAVRAHSEACRLDVGCYVGLVGLAGALLAASTWTGWQLAAAFLIPALGSTAGYYGGAYADREIDAATKPNRPVPAGRMSARSALVGMVVSVVVGLALAAVLNPVNLAFALVPILSGFVYGKFRTARRPLRVFVRGIATIMAFAIGTVITSGLVLWDLIALGLVFWQQDSMLHQVAAIDDTEIDRRTGNWTFPVRYGHRAALLVLVITLLFWFSSAAFQPISVSSRPFELAPYTPFVTVATVLITAVTVMLFRAPRPLTGQPVTRAYGTLAIARLWIATGFVAAAGATVLALILLIVSTALTLLTLRTVTASARQHPQQPWTVPSRPVR